MRFMLRELGGFNPAFGLSAVLTQPVVGSDSERIVSIPRSGLALF